MRPLSPIRVVEAIEPSASVLNPCEIHSGAATAAAAATPGATLFVQVDSAQAPVASTEVSLAPSSDGYPNSRCEFVFFSSYWKLKVCSRSYFFIRSCKRTNKLILCFRLSFWQASTSQPFVTHHCQWSTNPDGRISRRNGRLSTTQLPPASADKRHIRGLSTSRSHHGCSSGD